MRLNAHNMSDIVLVLRTRIFFSKDRPMSNNGLSKADDNDNENSFIDDQKFYKNAIHIGIMQNLISIGREVTV